MALYLKKRRKLLKKLCVGTSLFLLGSLVSSFLSLLFKWIFHSTLTVAPVFLILGMTLLCLLAYKPIDRIFTQFFKHYLFKQRSYAHMTLMNLAEELSLTLELQEFANLVVNTFGEVLHMKTVVLMVPNRVREDYEIRSAYGWSLADARRVRFPKESALVKLIHGAGPHVLVRDRVVRTFSWPEANSIASEFDLLQAGWVIPLFAKDEFTGLLGFSSEDPDVILDESDFQFFRQFAQSIGKSLRNSLSVTELRMVNEELQDVQSQLLQTTKLAAIEQLATGLAHEIHNPLTIISGKAQVLLLQKDRSPIDQRVEEVLKTIVSQTKRAADITRKLLMFSQSSGSPKELLKLDQVLEDTLALVSYQTSLDGIELVKTIPSGLPLIYANVHEVREVFLNLILNAVQSVGSSGKIQCEIKNRPEDEILEFRISDTGQGILAENLDKVFNPFFTTRPEAVGLGLFLSKQIIHRYGGSIRVESKSGEGSLFIVQFPYTHSLTPLTTPKEGTLALFPGN